MSRTVTNIITGNAFTVPNTTTADNVVVWRNTTGTSLGESFVSVASQNISNANSLTMNDQLANPGSSNTLWLNTSNGHLYRGSTDLEDIDAGDVSGPASSTDNAIARFDGATGKLLQNSGITIDDTNNVAAVKSIALVSSVANPSGSNALWLDATTGHLMKGSTDIESGAFEGISLDPAATNPGDETTLWINSATGHLTRGETDLETEGSGGDVHGPNLVYDNALARFDTTTGKAIQNSVVLLDDLGNMSAVRSASYTAVAANPGGVSTVWLDSATGHLMRGSADLEEAGTGDVVGPASATDNAIVRYDGTTGKLVQDSVLSIADTTGYILKNGSNILRTNDSNVHLGNSSWSDANFGVATQNSAVGRWSLNSCTSGSGNAVLGFACLQNATTAASNTACGMSSGIALTTGNQNALFGWGAGQALLTGSANTLIGYQAGSAYTGAETYNIVIGATVPGVVGESQKIRIGKSGTHNACYIQGINGITTAGAAVAVLVDADGQLGTVSSSIKVKQNVRDIEDTAWLHDLEIKNFEYIAAPDRKQAGVIAEQVATLKPELIIEQANGVLTVDYQYMFIAALKELQELKKEINAIKYVL